MMRNSKIASIAVAAIFMALLLSQCKPDPPQASTGKPDPDSLYVGTPYNYPNSADNLGLARYRKVIIPADNPMTQEGIALGRYLFYDSTLSLNRRVSCGSCHQQQYGFADNRVFSQNVLGSTKRNASSLANLGEEKAYFWDGRQDSIEAAVNDALTNEQHPDFTASLQYIDTTPKYKYLFKKAFGRPAIVTQDKVVKLISQFIRTLIAHKSKFDRQQQGLIQMSASEQNGLAIFQDLNKGDCTHCHTDPPYLTLSSQNNLFRNNALDTVADASQFKDLGRGGVTLQSFDNGKFKAPSLKNVAVSAPYMHDGRFATLEQVVNHYCCRDSLRYSPTIDPLMERFSKPIPDLTDQEKADLVAFLKALTDEDFLRNPAFSNPFH